METTKEDQPGSSMQAENPDTSDVSRKPQRFFNSIKTAIFVIGSSAIVFIAFRNTLTWHLQQFWGASGDLWQLLWNPIYDLFDGDEYNMAVWGSTLIGTVLFWLYNVAFIVIDFAEPTWTLQFKVQDNQKVTLKRFINASFRVLFNQLVIGTAIAHFGYRVAKWRNCGFDRELPTFHRVVCEIFVCICIEEVLFYYSHRLMHHPRIYKHIHKVHHEWTAPIGIVAQYAHPIEHILSNVLPVYIGPLICGSHIATAWLWYALALFSTTISHCGYHFPFLPSPEAHDFHHMVFNQNYGVLGVLDRFHGTDNQFRKSKAYDRHFMALSLVPVKELYPNYNTNEKHTKLK